AIRYFFFGPPFSVPKTIYLLSLSFSRFLQTRPNRALPLGQTRNLVPGLSSCHQINGLVRNSQLLVNRMSCRCFFQKLGRFFCLTRIHRSRMPRKAAFLLLFVGGSRAISQ